MVFETHDLQTELKQTKPFSSIHQEAWLSILRTAAVLEHSFESWLKPFGITGTQYNVLRILRGAGSPGLCRNEIGERMVRRVPDVTRLLDRLEDQRLIARTRRGSDRRFVTTTITQDGLKVLERLDDEVIRFHREELGHVDEGRLKQVLEALQVVRQRQ